MMLVLLMLGATPPASTVRHLEYSFSEYPTVGNGGGTGTLTADIMGAAPDGALIVQTKQTWTRPVYGVVPQPLIECEVFDGGTVRCTQPPYGLSNEQQVLLPLLGRDFFGSGSRDRRFEIHDGVKNDPDHQLMVGQLTPDADAKASGEFILKGMNSQLTGNVENDRQRLRYAIAYNVTTLVPTVVRVNWEAARAGGVFDDGGRIELRLTKDAAATPAP